ncbi:unnamed protein product (mitochondrion) [Plasmodiophora brassicae]|uniref:Uncharacterized protein n=1 Tax=Plasmodiophora brassicae TaxID=37360 RepID=A0A3P3Y738_PLABS|nr:unnamed protein product [Plasmodiophora brassicae]
MASSSPRTRSPSSSQRVWRPRYRHECWPLVGAILLFVGVVVVLQETDLLDGTFRVVAPRVIIVIDTAEAERVADIGAERVDVVPAEWVDVVPAEWVDVVTAKRVDVDYTADWADVIYDEIDGGHEVLPELIPAAPAGFAALSAALSPIQRDAAVLLTNSLRGGRKATADTHILGQRLAVNRHLRRAPTHTPYYDRHAAEHRELPYKWHYFATYNDIARRHYASLPRAYVLDTDSLVRLRPDTHRSADDCLHQVIPAALDYAVLMLYYVIVGDLEQ